MPLDAPVTRIVVLAIICRDPYKRYRIYGKTLWVLRSCSGELTCPRGYTEGFLTRLTEFPILASACERCKIGQQQFSVGAFPATLL